MIESPEKSLPLGDGLGLDNQLPERCLVVWRKVEEAGNVLSRDDQGMALAYRESVVDGDPDIIFHPDTGGIQLTEGTLHSHRLHSCCMVSGPEPVAPFYHLNRRGW
jgi:hypothetical protein